MTNSIRGATYINSSLGRSSFNEAIRCSDGVILFDGECRFCSDVVSALLRICKHHKILVCSTRSPCGHEITRAIDGEPEGTFAFLTKSTVYVGVDAYVAILSLEDRTRLLGRLLEAIPRRISTAVYGWVARHRLLVSRIWKIRDTCPIPAERFVPGAANHFKKGLRKGDGSVSVF